MYILLVEDDEDDSELILYAIRRTGYRGDVVWARDGQKALVQLSTAPLPMLVLLDLGLPGMDGSIVLHRIRMNKVTCDLPVIVVTGSRQDVPHILALGVQDYVVKTPDMFALFNVMSEIMVKDGC